MAMKCSALCCRSVSLSRFDLRFGTRNAMFLFVPGLFVVSVLFGNCVATLDLEEGDVCDTKGGQEWICTRLNRCPEALAAIRKGVPSQPAICRFVGFNPIVCCASNKSVTTEPSITDRIESKSQKKCEDYAKYVFEEVESVLFTSNDKEKVDTCAAVEALITNGTNTYPREYPHMALIGYGLTQGSAKWLCGGSLISERFVLSAAHCTLPGSRWGPARWVLLGEYNTGTTNDDTTGDAKTAIYEISERIDHPEYKPPKLYNDIALYKLKKNVEFNAYVRPVCLQYEPKITNKDALATGWGHTEWGGRGSKILQKARIQLLGTDLCQTTFASSSNTQKQLPNGIIEESMICAGDLVSGKDTCQGDSGGPLQVRLEQPYCMYRQIGVTSFGKNCGGNVPAIYTRISHYVSWIESIVWP